ncbi:hypothetical protein B0T18DRAFT_405766 [Schizothecium vesticola]|uniref:WD40 repeat-like protein n=1 Tax=Schizothecium vesticola TaxID=314040 RepID=A0AA40F0N9_9PEZI|nr:hypothetical protein B0T18DRAFT_405766 [Schizothecium vesticola]
MLAQIDLESCHGSGGPGEAEPSFVAIDDARFNDGSLDIAVGFVDGGFGVWRLDTRKKRLMRRYRHENSTNGELVAMAYSHPYLLTATGSVLISLYTFEVPGLEEGRGRGRHEHRGTKFTTKERSADRPAHDSTILAAPYLLTSLNSHTTRPPLALSIRKMAATTIASIAYTFLTRQGWSIGVQDLHIQPSPTDAKLAPEITTTRIAYTTPVDAGGVSRPSNPPATPRRRVGHRPTNLGTSSEPLSQITHESGPKTLSYTHPYLLATLPDNTLVLYMCTSSPSSLSISSGIRLWGHTSGISDAEITARGKAVSVSSRGEEMRVWELEGRFNGMSGRSVEIRPGQSPARGTPSPDDGRSAYDWDAKRNWVGFDDEMVIVLKEKAGGAGESLMVYDFT